MNRTAARPNRSQREHARFRGILLSILTLALTPLLPIAAQTVRVGIYQNPPKVFADEQGQPQGIFPDLIRAVAKEEGWTLEFVHGTWAEGLERLSESNIDLMTDVSFTPEREQKWAFCQEPVLSDWFQVVCHRNTAISSILDLADQRVAVLVNSVQQHALETVEKDFGIQIDLIPVPDYDTGVLMIRNRRADLLIANRYLSAVLDNSPDLISSPIIFHPTRLHFAAPQSDPKHLLPAIDRHLKEWKSQSGSVYYKTLKRWTGEAPQTVFPRFLKTIAASAIALFLLTAAILLLLRWQVKIRTAELEKKTQDLSQALDEIKQAKSKAIQQERLHALGQMAGGIAHDFNNVLTPIIGFSDLLLHLPQRREDQAFLQRTLESISRAGHDGAEIVKRMKEFYRTCEPGEAALIDPCESVKTVIELARPRWAQVGEDGTRHIEIETKLQKNLFIRIREAELREALMNLIGNAVDAMPAGGTITLRIKRENQHVVISVTDTGTGMPEEVKQRCLTAFFTTKGHAGTGMGLPMVKRLCDDYHAKIAIDSKENQGTTVSLIFPQQDGEPPIKKDAAVPLKKIRPLNILTVDDDKRSLDVLSTVLSEEGHAVIAFTNPGEALQQACTERYDVVITDRSMQGLSGDELARSILSLPAPPIVFMLTGTPSRHEIPKQSGLHVLNKPLNLYALNDLFVELGFEQKASEP